MMLLLCSILSYYFTLSHIISYFSKEMFLVEFVIEICKFSIQLCCRFVYDIFVQLCCIPPDTRVCSPVLLPQAVYRFTVMPVLSGYKYQLRWIHHLHHSIHYHPVWWQDYNTSTMLLLAESPMPFLFQWTKIIFVSLDYVAFVKTSTAINFQDNNHLHLSILNFQKYHNRKASDLQVKFY